MSRVTYRLFDTPLGWAGIGGTEDGIARVVLPVAARQDAERAIKEGIGTGSVETEHCFPDTVADLQAYFRCEPVEFSCKISPVSAGDFDLMVWKTACAIPYGSTETYGRLAALIGRPGAARAVGQALGRNPIPIIVPCHRVLRADGGLGGYNGGLEWKRRLLEIERSALERSINSLADDL